MIAVLVLGRIETHDLPVCAARSYDRNLALELDEGFKNRRLRADCAEGRGGLARVPDHGLTLAVVAEAPRLEHGGLAESRKRNGEFLGRCGGREWRGRDGGR